MLPEVLLNKFYFGPTPLLFNSKPPSLFQHMEVQGQLPGPLLGDLSKFQEILKFQKLKKIFAGFKILKQAS